MLHRLAVMGLRMRHGGDDADLRIGPADAFDAGALAQSRALAVGGDEEARFDRRRRCRASRATPKASVVEIGRPHPARACVDGTGSSPRRRQARGAGRRARPYGAAAPPSLSSSSKPRKWGRKAAFSGLSVISIASMACALGASCGPQIERGAAGSWWPPTARARGRRRRRPWPRPARHRRARCGSLAARAWQAQARGVRPAKPPPAITTSKRSRPLALASSHCPAMPRSAGRQRTC